MVKQDPPVDKEALAQYVAANKAYLQTLINQLCSAFKGVPRLAIGAVDNTVEATFHIQRVTIDLDEVPLLAVEFIIEQSIDVPGLVILSVRKHLYDMKVKSYRLNMADSMEYRYFTGFSKEHFNHFQRVIDQIIKDHPVSY